MSVNISSPSNSTFPDSDPVIFDCVNSAVRHFITTAYNITRTLLLLPLSILILYLGHQRWRQQRSFNTTSHSDIFTYNMAVMALLWFLGTVFFYCGSSELLAEFFFTSVSLYGQGFFHLMTCVERYLAVVHPITYLGLRKAGGVRIRNISIGCVWLLCLGWSFITTLNILYLTNTMYFCFLSFSLVVITFCSLSALCVLIRPGPGEGGGDRERVDQSKQRAFFTIMTITGVLWLWFVAALIAFALDLSPLLSRSVTCVVKTSALVFYLPSSLVLPLLYLHRAGKLPGCKHTSGSAE